MRPFLTFLCFFILIFFLCPLLCLGIREAPGENPPQTVTLPTTLSHGGRTVSSADLVVEILAAHNLHGYRKEALKAAAVAVATQVFRQYTTTGTGDGWKTKPPEEAKKDWGEYWFSVYWPQIQQAVEEVWGEVLLEQGTFAETPVFPLSWGQTEGGVSCPYDETAEGFCRTVTVPLEDFSAVFPRYASALNIKTARNGRVDTVTSGETVLTGRQVMDRFSLLSPAFSLAVNNQGAVFTCKGVGDGVGMSLYGANEEAKQGKNYREILLKFYPETTLQEANRPLGSK